MRALTCIIALLAAPACAEVPVVVTDIAPVHSLVAQVIGDLGQPRLLLDAASDPHHFQMRPSQARRLAEADLLIWMGPGLTPWLDRVRSAVAGGARSLPLLDAPGAPLRIEAGEVHVDDGAAHDHGPVDPHAWLDPLNAVFHLGLIARELAAIDPVNADAYAANARTAGQGLADLHDTLGPELAPVADVTLIATHDTYRYLLARYGLHQAGALSDSAGNAPGAAGLSALQQFLEDTAKPVCVLQEPGTSAESILNLVPEVPLKVVELDPHGRGHAPGPGLYAAMLRDLAKALASCADQDR